jgi:D-galacturonate reductase
MYVDAVNPWGEFFWEAKSHGECASLYGEKAFPATGDATAKKQKKKGSKNEDYSHYHIPPTDCAYETATFFLFRRSSRFSRAPFRSRGICHSNRGRGRLASARGAGREGEGDDQKNAGTEETLRRWLLCASRSVPLSSVFSECVEVVITRVPALHPHPTPSTMSPIDALMIGAGEYTTGCVFTAAGAAPDKPAGVVAITLTDMRRRGKIGTLTLCDAVGTRMPAVRQTMAEKIGKAYKDMDLTMRTFPEDDVEFDANAFRAAIATMKRGSVVTLFTPDDTHHAICMACVEHGLHVLCAKPVVKKLSDHLALAAAAKKNNVLVAVEYHKRFDPIYVDARDRIKQTLGPFSFFSSTMTQPKAQLDTFAQWAGKSSDISYYLNSHHMDIHSWSVRGESRPRRVTAFAAFGAANERLQPKDGRKIEDTITLVVEWANKNGSNGIANYTASWIAPKSDCHTQQYFHYMGHGGEIRADQGHRGYTMATDVAGFTQLNPLYMKYTPSPDGCFAGQQGYGYRSIEEFCDAAVAVNDRTSSVQEIRYVLYFSNPNTVHCPSESYY